MVAGAADAAGETDSVGVRRVVLEAVRELEKAGVPEPEASAETLLAELLDVGRLELRLRDPELTVDQKLVYESWISRRRCREPVQRILGYAYFRNLKLKLNNETLIPRPDTESVVEAAFECIDELESCVVLDVGTGSGAIAISVAQERPECEVQATDISETALKLARHNAAESGTKVRFRLADLVLGLNDLTGEVDLLVSNPPYVRSEDLDGLAPEVRNWDSRAALDGGFDGLDFYRRIFAETPPLLKDGAYLVLEVGDGQGKEVLRLGRQAGFAPIGERPDLTGTPRAVLLGWRAG